MAEKYVLGGAAKKRELIDIRSRFIILCAAYTVQPYNKQIILVRSAQ